MNSTQKRINSPSDDPSGAANVVVLRAEESCLSGYLDACARAYELLSSADSALQSASELIISALETAEQAATETYTDEQLDAMAIEILSNMESLYALANTQLGGTSVFAGNDIDNDAYEITLGMTIADDAFSNADVTAITGEIDDMVWVQFDDGGTIGGTEDLTYRYSTDGGETWTEATLAAGDTVLDLGTCTGEFATGTTVTAADGEAEGAGFVIRETYMYTGSSRNMEVEIAENSSMAVTSVGSEIFGGVDENGDPYPDPNLFETLGDLAAYMIMGDSDAVAESLDKLNECHEQLTTANADIGARMTRAAYAESNQTMMLELVTNSISSEEDADATQLLIELNQAEYVYQAVLQSTADIMSMSLLDYI
jgi:flagellar hook-associated protein 3 FlgL